MATTGTVLRYVAALAGRAEMPIETKQLDGEPAPAILEQARVWSAGLIVIGRSGSPGAGQPYVGSQIRHVLEFAEVPVLVVTQADR
jgi:nucleotide-binding universal stress UspA family protein